MSDFEMMLTCLLVPVSYVLIYIAGKYDVLNLICKMLEEKVNEYIEKDGGRQ